MMHAMPWHVVRVGEGGAVGVGTGVAGAAGGAVEVPAAAGGVAVSDADGDASAMGTARGSGVAGVATGVVEDDRSSVVVAAGCGTGSSVREQAITSTNASAPRPSAGKFWPVIEARPPLRSVGSTVAVRLQLEAVRALLLETHAVRMPAHVQRWHPALEAIIGDEVDPTAVVDVRVRRDDLGDSTVWQAADDCRAVDGLLAKVQAGIDDDLDEQPVLEGRKLDQWLERRRSSTVAEFLRVEEPGAET